MTDRHDVETEHDRWLIEQFNKGVISETELVRSLQLPPEYYDTVVNAGRMIGEEDAQGSPELQ